MEMGMGMGIGMVLIVEWPTTSVASDKSMGPCSNAGAALSYLAFCTTNLLQLQRRL